MAELRFNPLLGTYTMVASNRAKRPQMPKDWCPFCPGSGKVPEKYDVLKYDNDFPVLRQNPPEIDDVGSHACGLSDSIETGFYRAKESRGNCEVVLYSPNHTASLHDQSVEHIRKLVDLWCQRMTDLSSIKENKYIMMFENRGEEIGVTMPHPHGQIYAYSWIPQKLQIELENAQKHFDKTGECIICRMNKEEVAFQNRIIFENDSFFAYIPYFTDYPYGVFVTAKNHKNYFTDFTDNEKNDLAQILKVVTGTFDRIFDRPFPYMMCVHQNPVNSEKDFPTAKDSYHFHIEFYTPLRAKNLIKYYASSESGAWAAANTASVENTAKDVIKAKLNYCVDKMPELFKTEFIKEYKKLYGTKNKNEIIVIASPARINVIGEHVDNYGGNVFPASIDKYLYVAIRKRDDKKIIYDDIRFPGRYEFNIDDNFTYNSENGYTNYLNGILQIIKNDNNNFDCGFEALIFSCIPDGGGISSSSALEVGFGFAIKELYNLNIDRIKLALLGQKSEHDFMNVKCGIMDQFAIAMGKKNMAIDLNCGTLDYQYVPLELGDYRIVIMNSNKKRRLADSEYNARRQDCINALELIQKNGYNNCDALCHLSEEELPKLKTILTDEILYRRTLHCVTENAREKKAVNALKENDLQLLGELLKQSHQSLRNNYEVSCQELDTLVDYANQFDGCLGARLIGAGFGGCSMAFVHKEKVKKFIDELSKFYKEKIGYEASFFSCTAGDGTHII